MPRTILLHDRARILAALAAHPALHVYAIGDLDDFFFPFTTWFALEDDAGQIRQIALLYTGAAPPVLLAFTAEPPDELGALLASLLPVLPRRFYLHVTPGAERPLAEEYELSSHGLHHKMVLADREPVGTLDTTAAVALMPRDRREIEAFYAAAYPGNWFDPRMLQTGRYMGVRIGGTLVSVAGVHVFSPARRVAALGNIATLPFFRGRGLGALVTAALCRKLALECDTIGLNVLAENLAAIGLYERLGFVKVAEYEEIAVRARAMRDAPVSTGSAPVSAGSAPVSAGSARPAMGRYS